MKLALGFSLLLVTATSVANDCIGQSKIYKVDSSSSFAGQGYEGRVLSGSGANCLAPETNQPQFLIKLTDASVDGYRFCTSALTFQTIVRMLRDENDYRLHGQGVMGVLIYNADNGLETNLEDSRAVITMRNRRVFDTSWIMYAASGYYKVGDPTAETAALEACKAKARESLPHF